jgi:hypothetical protein
MCKQPDAGAPEQTLDAADPELERVALVQLIATMTLVLSTLIVVTAVSIGLARADVVGDVTSPDAAGLAAGGLVALWLVGLAGLAAARVAARRRR